MKFSESWLREWVSPAISTDELSEQISMAGLEVDGVEPVAGEFTGVVVGEVVECGQHPDADKLRVTKVNVGGEELLDIVCGAPNCRLGLKVAVATVGAVLPGNFKIKKAKLRGQPSHGMLCSFSELGIDVESDGIMELPVDAPIGTDFREFLGLNDSVIEVDLTANRADCLGLAGLAREVGVINSLPVTQPAIDAVAPVIDDVVGIKVDAPEQCPRYLGRVVKNVNVKAASPLWMQEKLRRSGIRSIDAIVDITAFVMLELGQPMHAFDLARINGDIQVRMAKEGDELTLLDGSECKPNTDTLLIADDKGPLALAGIFGGEHSGVNGDTTDVLLECAFFAPLAILGRARAYGLHTDASHRFERGVDPQLQARAMERATALLIEICGGEAGPVVEAVSEAHLPKAATITLRRDKLDGLLGHHIADEQVEEILTRLGCDVSAIDGGWQAKAPSWRFDMAIEQDLIEEVARIYGYNNIPNLAPVAKLEMVEHREADLHGKRLRSLFVDRGFQEAITYSFVDPKQQALLHPGVEPLVLPNPISSEMSAMRLSLWTGLLSSVAYNQARQQSRVRLFETGLRFIPDEGAENGIRQEPMIAGVIAGQVADEHWQMDSRAVDFFDLKGDVEAMLALTNDADAFSFRPASHPALHPGQSAEILKGDKVVGLMGAVHPQHEKKLGLNGRTLVFELEMAAVADRQLPDAQPVSKFTASRRDIAVVVKEEVGAGDVIGLIKKVGVKQLVGVNLFDVYQGKGIEHGHKSLAIALTLQDVERTLEDQDIADAVDTIVAALAQEFNAQLRD
ncbi:phenylalanine--tRNA ligase subunit beta [Ferrimonas sediminicola]|uniref:Phenylalanine--tRNA ligase beta subunit n=1 Tax=Ferrimonas sediminicola TaxID=2569538 RepID=A0A4U1BDT3_9GAMM|nr:phenylalanine--tRNA ligase subunit beta [Ferrimonas sediminicola]TKB48479.1 phenylalanine--tRNA ligase subunit beta [Ferrimonas sediminicola]